MNRICLIFAVALMGLLVIIAQSYGSTSISQNFDAMPAWSSSQDAGWGSAAVPTPSSSRGYAGRARGVSRVFGP